MALHEITIHENTGASKALAPYLGSYAAKDTVRLDGFADAVARQCGLPAIQAMAILTGSFDAMGELEKDGLVRIHTDLGVVCGVIVGSFPTADAAFDPERNELCLALYLDDAVRLSLANVVPAIVLEGDVTRVRVDNAADIAQPKPYNLIHGQHVFRVAGHKLILSDEGASAYLMDTRGTVYPLVIDQVESDQLFRAHTASLLEPGDYKLVVASRGGDPNGDLQRPYHKVKYLRVEDPVVPLVLTSIQTAGVQEGQVNETNTTSIRGQDNLYPWDSERDSVVVHFDGQELTVPDVEFSAGNETLQFQIPQRVGEVLDDDDTLSFTVTINGAVGTIDAVWKH